MILLAAMPNSVPAFTAARNMSPVEICGIPKCSLMKLAWVPFPAPGPPNKMMRMILLPFLNKTPRGNGGEWVLVLATPGIISQTG